MGDKKIRLLLVEDDKFDQMAFVRFVENERLPYEYTIAGSIAESEKLIASKDFDIVIADYMLGDGTLFDLLDLLKDLPVIVTTGAGNEEIAVKAMKSGACDYLIKDSAGLYLSTLPFTVESAVSRKKAEKELENYRENLELLVKERTAECEAEIEEHKQTEKALRESEEHLRSLMESASGFAVYRLVSDDQTPHKLRVVFASPSIKDILGIQEPLEFTTWFENMHPDDVVRVTEANQKALETYKFNEEYRTYNKKKGEWRWIHAISTGGMDAAGWNHYANGIIIDITEKQRAREELENKAQKLEELNTALNVLLKKRSNDKTDLEKRFLGNIKQMVLPYLDKLEHGNCDAHQKVLIDILRENLREVTSSFSYNLSSKYFSLTYAEIQVADFIKNSRSTKEIASILNISPKTVKNYRQKIREKIGIANKKINLKSYLSSFN